MISSFHIWLRWILWIVFNLKLVSKLCFATSQFSFSQTCLFVRSQKPGFFKRTRISIVPFQRFVLQEKMICVNKKKSDRTASDFDHPGSRLSPQSNRFQVRNKLTTFARFTFAFLILYLLVITTLAGTLIAFQHALHSVRSASKFMPWKILKTAIDTESKVWKPIISLLACCKESGFKWALPAASVGPGISLAGRWVPVLLKSK